MDNTFLTSQQYILFYYNFSIAFSKKIILLFLRITNAFLQLSVFTIDYFEFFKLKISLVLQWIIHPFLCMNCFSLKIYIIICRG